MQRGALELIQPPIIREDEQIYDRDRDFVKLPLFDLSVAAGDGALMNRPETVAATLAFRRDWLGHEGLHPKSLALFRVAGDSMEPSLRDHDVFLVDRTSTDIQSEKIYVIRIESEAFVKRLRLHGDAVVIVSDNPAYQPWMRPLVEVTVIGRVVWLGRRLP